MTDPDLELEHQLLDEGAASVGGLDEVGRGAWAGPVTVGVVVIDRDSAVPPEGIRDSKLLSAARRRALAPRIRAWAADWAVASASASECDELGMRGAVALASWRALGSLGSPPEVMLVDGPLDLFDPGVADLAPMFASLRREPERPRVVPEPKADLHRLSVAAASILAKVWRDEAMGVLAESFPAFGFESNAGYPAPVHRRALAGYGLTTIHRRSWSFARDLPFGAVPAEARRARAQVSG